MSTARRMAALAACLSFSLSASAEPPATRSESRPEDPATVAARLDEQARRSDTAAREGRARANALTAVARIARAKVDTLPTRASDRLEAEEGLAHLQAHIQSVEAGSRGDDRSASEYRAAAERLRGRPSKSDVAAAPAGAGAPGAAAGAGAGGCDPPFFFDSSGHKRWRAECF